jgi:cytochrome c556
MRYLALCLGLCAATAFAHENVKNPLVLERMESMSAIADGVEALGDMAKGVRPFDQSEARAAAARIAKHASETPQLFKQPADDPKSEARREIWENFEDFTAKSVELADLAMDLSVSLASRKDLRTAMRDLGANCKSCHEIYRK